MRMRAFYAKKREELYLRYTRFRYPLLYHRIVLILRKSSLSFFYFYLTLFFANQIAQSAAKGSGALYFLAYFVLLLGFLLSLYSALTASMFQALIAKSLLPLRAPYLISKMQKYFLYLIPPLLIFHLKVCFIEKLQVEGSSMRPTLAHEQNIWIEKFTTGIALPPLDFPFAWQLPAKIFPQGLRAFKRGDIVVFVYPGLDSMDSTPSNADLKKKNVGIFVKRVIALANEEYRFYKGRIYINGILLEESYLPAGLKTPLHPEIDPLRGRFVPEKLRELGLFFSYAAQYGLVAAGRVPEGSLLVLGDERNISGDSRTFGFVPISYIIGKSILISKKTK